MMIPRMMPPITVFLYVLALGAFSQSEIGTVGDWFGVVCSVLGFLWHVKFGKIP